MLEDGSPLYVLNPDVVYQDGFYVMVGNIGGRATMDDLCIYKSTDGVHWSAYAPGYPVLVNAGVLHLLTPQIMHFDRASGRLMIVFARGRASARCRVPEGLAFPGKSGDRLYRDYPPYLGNERLGDAAGREFADGGRHW